MHNNGSLLYEDGEHKASDFSLSIPYVNFKALSLGHNLATSVASIRDFAGEAL